MNTASQIHNAPKSIATSLLRATPMTMEPAVKTREARRMVGLRPKRSQKGPATSENSHVAPTLMGIEGK